MVWSLIISVLDLNRFWNSLIFSFEETLNILFSPSEPCSLRGFSYILFSYLFLWQREKTAWQTRARPRIFSQQTAWQTRARPRIFSQKFRNFLHFFTSVIYILYSTIFSQTLHFIDIVKNEIFSWKFTKMFWSQHQPGPA